MSKWIRSSRQIAGRKTDRNRDGRNRRKTLAAGKGNKERAETNDVYVKRLKQRKQPAKQLLVGRDDARKEKMEIPGKPGLTRSQPRRVEPLSSEIRAEGMRAFPHGLAQLQLLPVSLPNKPPKIENRSPVGAATKSVVRNVALNEATHRNTMARR
jgi:hypothetical protein